MLLVTALTIPALERGRDRSHIQHTGSPHEGCSSLTLERRSRERPPPCSRDLVAAS